MDPRNTPGDRASEPTSRGMGTPDAELAEVARETARLLATPGYDDARLSALDERARALRERIRAERAPPAAASEGDCWPWQSGRSSEMTSGG
jgi:hypothetical protein